MPYADEDEGQESDTGEEGSKSKKCYGLVLSDSHNLGPYQAGVIIGLLNELTKKDLPTH